MKRDKKRQWETIDSKILSGIHPEVAIEIAHMPKRDRDRLFETFSYLSKIKENPELAIPLLLLRKSKKK